MRRARARRRRGTTTWRSGRSASSRWRRRAGSIRQVAQAAVDRLADALDTCATDEGRKGTLVDGAARVVAQIDEKGNIAGTSVKVDPGAGVAQMAVLCLVAPIRMLTFPPADAGPRGFAVEALWGRVIPGATAR